MSILRFTAMLLLLAAIAPVCGLAFAIGVLIEGVRHAWLQGRLVMVNLL